MKHYTIHWNEKLKNDKVHRNDKFEKWHNSLHLHVDIIITPVNIYKIGKFLEIAAAIPTPQWMKILG